MEIKNNIGQINPYQAQIDKSQGPAQAAQAAKIGKGSPAFAAPKGDTLTLSPEAKLHTEAYRAAMNAPELRQSKIDAIKARVDSGEYQPDSRQIAAKLLAEEPGLFEA